VTGLATVAAERIKLSTTRSPVWSVAVAVALSLGLAAIQPAASFSDSPLPPERAAIGVATFGVPVLMILASMTITGEYRTGMIRATFMATPNRAGVLCARAGIAAVFAGVSAAVMVIASIAVARALASEHVGARLSLTHAETWRPGGAVGLYAALGAVLAIGLGVLLRYPAAVIAVLLLMPFVIEPLLGSAPRVGEHLGPLLPFTNAYEFTGVPWFSGSPLWWGPLGALLYFTSVVTVVFLAAIVIINRRDP
jgi:ABC-2 type transport system permease protein